MNKSQNIVLKPLITEFDLKVRVGNLVKEIADNYDGDELIVIGLLKGSFMFLADLVRLLYLHNIPLQIDFIIASSYGEGTESSGKVKMIRDITTDIKGKWILLVDDILDTGRTMSTVATYLKKKNPAVLKTYAFHYETGEPIPQELIDKLENAKQFNQGFKTVEYLAASFLDMDWHVLTDTTAQDAAIFEKESIGIILE